MRVVTTPTGSIAILLLTSLPLLEPVSAQVNEAWVARYNQRGSSMPNRANALFVDREGSPFVIVVIYSQGAGCKSSRQGHPPCGVLVGSSRGPEFIPLNVVFHRMTAVLQVDSGDWSDCSVVQATEIQSVDARDGDFFGRSLDVARRANGDFVLAVGAYLDGSLDPESGAVHVFESSVGWSQTAYLRATDTRPHLKLGLKVALDPSGERLIAGASESDLELSCDAEPPPMGGRVYHFELDTNGVWLEVESFRGNNTECEGAADSYGTADRFGSKLVYDRNRLDMIMVLARAEDGSQSSPPITIGPASPETDDDSAPARGAVYQFNLVSQ